MQGVKYYDYYIIILYICTVYTLYHHIMNIMSRHVWLLQVMGNKTEFIRVTDILIDILDFNQDINVSVFETNIRGMIVNVYCIYLYINLLVKNLVQLSEHGLNGQFTIFNSHKYCHILS